MNDSQPTEKIAMRAADVAAMLDVSERWVWENLRAVSIKFGKHRRWFKADVLAYVRNTQGEHDAAQNAG